MIETIARIRIELQDTDPKVWRQVDVPLSTTLMALHEIIQVAMGWRNGHLFEFMVGGRIYGLPDPEFSEYGRTVYKAKSIRLQTVVDRGINRFVYVYDFGDNWRHDILIEEVRDGDADVDYPTFVGGARRCPPEDVGGTTGFEEFLEAVTDPGHEEHDRMLDWCGGVFDPEDINERLVRMIIEDFAARRRGPLMSHRSGSRRNN